MQIERLEVENFGIIKNISLDTSGVNPVIISGKNAQGKSTIWEAIIAAIGGPKASKVKRPIREGESEAKITVDLGDMVVTRLYRNGTTAVKVVSKDGAEYKSQQALLDSFLGKFTLDPMLFTGLKARDQKEALLELVTLDVDLDELDAERAAKFDERTAVGQRKAALGAAPVVDETLPTIETSASEILARVRSAQEVTALNEADRDKLERFTNEEAEHVRMLDELAARTKEIEERKARIREQIVAQQAVVAGLPEPEDIDVLQVELAEVEVTNATIRANSTAREIVAQITARDTEYKALTEAITKIDDTKAAALARAEFPVPGLGFDSEGVTFNGLPFSDASTAEQIRVSMGIAVSANPKLRVINIKDGSLLDEDSMKVLTESAEAHGVQLWIEVVANGDGVGFVIEEGEVVGS